MSNTILLPFQPDAMTPAQLAAVSYLARYSGHASRPEGRGSLSAVALPEGPGTATATWLTCHASVGSKSRLSVAAASGKCG